MASTSACTLPRPVAVTRPSLAPAHARRRTQSRHCCRAIDVDQIQAGLADAAEATSSAVAAQGPITIEGVYIALGLNAVLFLLTFGLAPRFKTSFKEADSWIEIYDRLMAMGGVPGIIPKEAAEKAKRGAVLMDIRMARKYEQAAARDSKSYPLYQPISGMSIPANIRRAGFSFFGIYGSERNPDFVAEVEQDIKKGQEIIVACEFGGSLETKPGMKSGFQSQSLKAAYYLKDAGFNKVSYLKGGLDTYRREVEGLLDAEEQQAAAAATPSKSGVFSLFGR